LDIKKMRRLALIPISLLLLAHYPSIEPFRGSFAASSNQLPDIKQSKIEKIIERGFKLSDPNYIVTRSAYAKRLKALTTQLIALQKQGKDMACSDQMLVEARWLLEHTTDWARLDTQLAKLARSLQGDDQNFANQQSREDGAWGACYEKWFLKLDATIDPLGELADQGKAPRYPLVFLQRISSSDSLVAYLEGLLVSDIAETGTDQRDELGAVTGALSQMLFKDDLRRLINQGRQEFVIDDEYVDIYRDFLDSWQDPATGYWGAWYRSQGKLFKSADLSLTFHTISYRKGRVNHWPKIIDTTLSIKAYEYPYGWLHNGGYKHHNNYDVVKILRYGWPHMSDEQKERSRIELTAMIDWCLTMPMEANTLFATDPTFYSSPANYYYYGVSFLDEIGYWDKSRRFWTDRDFPQAHTLCHLIKARLASLDLDAPPAAAAKEKLEANCPES
jgi:hypothetical protein